MKDENCLGRERKKTERKSLADFGSQLGGEGNYLLVLEMVGKLKGGKEGGGRRHAEKRERVHLKSIGLSTSRGKKKGSKSNEESEPIRGEKKGRGNEPLSLSFALVGRKRKERVPKWGKQGTEGKSTS